MKTQWRKSKREREGKQSSGEDAYMILEIRTAKID